MHSDGARLQSRDASEALGIVEFHRKNTQKLAEALLNCETLTRDEIVELIKPEKEASSPSGVAFSV